MPTHLVPLLLVLGLAATAATAENPASFRETFDRVDGSRWFISDGWSNGDYQNCQWSRRAVRADEGVLKLMFLPDPKGGEDHRCGEIQTHDRYLHGTFEARVRTDHATSGVNAAFFTYIGEVHERPHDEIDFEILTRDTGMVEVNTYVEGKPHHRKVVPLPRAADADWHIFSFQWEPGRIRWFVDGELVHEATRTLPQNPQKIYLSHWGTGTLSDWMGRFTAPAEPLAFEVDWIAWTAPGEPCAFPESVLCRP